MSAELVHSSVPKGLDGDGGFTSVAITRGTPPALKAAGNLGAAATRSMACDPDLSTPDECWTNCKTEDDITICDIIRLDTFWPEAPPTRPGVFRQRR